MLTFKSPSNRIILEVIGTEPLHPNDREWIKRIVAALESRLIELDHALHRQKPEVAGPQPEGDRAA